MSLDYLVSHMQVFMKMNLLRKSKRELIDANILHKTNPNLYHFSHYIDVFLINWETANISLFQDLDA